MKRNYIFKEAGILLIAAVLILSAVTVTADTVEVKNIAPLTRAVIFEDGFETYDDWLIDFPPWTTIDVNGDPTFGHSGCTWPGEGDPYAFIIFNPSTTTPPLTGDPDAQPHSGDKYAAGFNNDNAGYTNDDWLISPELGPADFDDVTFWAKSYLDTYNYELFEVSVSTTDTNPASFTVISPVEQPGHLAWEEFSYNLDAYDGESIYIGIHMISIDSWFLMIDDFVVTGAGGAPLTANAGGPYEAEEGEPIQFQGDASGGVPPYSFHWDFGNGDTSDEEDPIYTYDEAGVYDVTLTVTDDQQSTDDDLTTATITAKPCCFEVTPKRFNILKLKADVKEICGLNHSGVNWTIEVTGGVFFPASTTWNGVITSIPANGVVTINTGLMIGLGSITITITIDDCDPEVFDGRIILFFIIV
ncbi:MAG: choice-of-anchor J domain-containing protein [Thermoplasmatales archaeon]|nr:MAG: choice-of-anchor J domain-containing protein [Thermoplasmatales archaeon]